jgi:hypothetical protein
MLADLVLLVHLAFVIFVVLGGVAVLWRPWMAWIHLPAAAWGVFIELSGGICPLTPLEQQLREQAGQQGYDGGFVEHYVVALLYPEALTRELQFVLAGVVIVMNAAVYGWVLARRRRARRTGHQRQMARG